MEAKTFVCTHCEKCYTRKENLTRHTEEEHTTQNKIPAHRNWFKCDFVTLSGLKCGHESDKRNKARHIRAKHSGKFAEKKIPTCTHCEKTFHCKSNVNKHVRRFHQPETIIESESVASQTCKFVGVDKDFLIMHPERESEKETNDNPTNNGMCLISRDEQATESKRVFDQKLKMLERATRACRLTTRAVQGDLKERAFTKERTWEQEMELLRKRFRRESVESELGGKESFVKALNLRRAE